MDTFANANPMAGTGHVPAVYVDSAFPRDGGLLSYGVDVVDRYRRAASYVDRILRGEKPGDLPVQFPTKFEMVLNLKTAKALGLAITPIDFCCAPTGWAWRGADSLRISADLATITAYYRC
jgi:ABC-type uncharacterized transport system substrate-binding protein